MLPYARMRSRRAAEAIVVLSLSIAAAVLQTYPLAFKIGHVARTDMTDGRWSIWVVNWVARTLVADPRHLFDANIFYPHTRALAFSEMNLGAGLLGLPVYWLTRNPYTTHNAVLLMSFVLSAVGMYYLCRRLTGDRGAAAVGALAFAFTPYLFSHTAHIQLLLSAGLPFSMLALDRLLERPTFARAMQLALALVLQAIACGYYGVFAAMLVGFGVLFFATTRRLWTVRQFWVAVTTAAVVSLGSGLLLYLPYLQLNAATGFARSLRDANMFSADWHSYLVSNAWLHRWMLSLVRPWKEVLFPGFVATGFGIAGAVVGMKRRAGIPRDVAIFYTLVAIIAFWLSFGPPAGLYTLLFNTVPMFSFMRAPSRFGVLVAFALAVLSAVAVSELVRSRPRGQWIAGGIALATLVELAGIPLGWREAPRLPSPYLLLATLPRGPVVELPFFETRPDFPRHTFYMLWSTYHWQPLVNGYSDYIPADFREIVVPVSHFPTIESFKLLQPIGARYVVFHMTFFDTATQQDIERRIQDFEGYLRPLAHDDEVWLYEIVGYP